MAGRNPGPPPVGDAHVAQSNSREMVVYREVQETFRQDTSIQRALLGMFHNDKALRDRFLSVTFSLLAKKSDLLKTCTPLSLVQSIRDAAAMGLEPLTDECAIIEYNGIAQAQPMWRGYIKRIRNSGKVSNVDCQLVYENDIYEVELGTHPRIRHVPARIEKKWVVDDEEKGTGHWEVVKDRGGYYGAYAYALFPDGSLIPEVMSLAEIIEVRDQFSKGFRFRPDSNPWTTSFGEMARKTVIRRLAKRLPQEAVDTLLAADAALDEKQRQVEISVNKLEEQTADLRQLAMQATGLIGPGTNAEAEPTTEPQPDAAEAAKETPAVVVVEAQRASSEPQQEADGEHHGGAPEHHGSGGTRESNAVRPDPNVAAAMEMARQQEAQRRANR